MTREEVLRILSEHRRRLGDFDVVSIAVFGSVARDQASPASDVDLLVEFEPGARVGIFKFLDLKEYLESILDRRVDLVTRDALKHQLRHRIVEEAVSAI